MTGRNDASYDDVSLKDITKGMPVKVIGSVETKEESASPSGREDTALLEFMNEAIAELQADPTGKNSKRSNLNQLRGQLVSTLFVTLNHIEVLPCTHATRRHRP